MAARALRAGRGALTAAVETPAAARAAAASAPPGPLALAELRNGSRELAELLAERAEAGDALNAFLLAAGLRQIAEDRLEADHLRLAEVERVAGGAGWSRTAAVARAAGTGLGALPRGLGALRRWDARLGRLVDGLADAVVAGRLAAGLAGEARALAAERPAAALGAQSVRLPSCFRGFDQHPDDLARLVDRLRALTGAGPAPVAVVGLRTSGSYLAPLAAALLRARGAPAVALTLRPWHPLPAPKRRALRAVSEAGGLVAVTDDPPSSGASLARAAAAIERLAPRRVVLMLALFDPALPPALARWPAVVLPWEEWSVHERLEPGSVAATLERLWPGARVRSVRRLPLADRPGRGHCAARYRVAIGGRAPEDVLVRGAGLGYFGEHALAVGARLEGWTPEIHGVIDGLVYRRWLPADERSPADAATVARYAAERRRAAAVPVDRAAALRGEDAVWEVASNLLSRAYGRGWRAVRVAALDRAMRELLRSGRTSVVDGAMAPDTWFAGPRKVKTDERAFSNRNLACYDAAFDVAAAAAWERLDGDELRRAFAGETGEWIDDERWLVYQLVAHWAAVRDGRLSRHAARRASARAVQRYVAALYLDDLARPARGPCCAIDVDGVLETDTLGFPGPSPAGALALRALLAHGLRPLLVSGRSAGEVAERCRAYGLAGGVAEYGAALYDARAGEEVALLAPDAAAAVERARAQLAARADVELGLDHRHSVRARRPAGGGPIAADAVHAALAAAAPVVLRVVHGEGQTDLVPAAVDKATGLRALLGRLADGPFPGVALAVGDGPEDLPMLRLADRAVAVANAAGDLRRAGVPAVRRPYQSGLALAVGQTIGHAPGACPACRPPARVPGSELVLAVLGARERGRAGLLARAVALSLRHRAHARC